MIRPFHIQILWCLLLATELLTGYKSNAQSRLTIEACYALARQQYPATRQLGLIQQSRQYAVENAAKGYLPQLTVSGQASYQSDVTQIPVSIPGMNIQPLDKDQYRVYAEVNQTIYDNGVIKQQQKILEANAKADEQRTETELYKLKERINQLYFGVLVIDAQLQQTATLKKDLDAGIQKATAAINNGTAFKSSRDVLQAEVLKTDQKIIEWQASRKAYITMLGLFIGRTLDEGTILQQPQQQLINEQINRPELSVFSYQNNALSSQKKLLEAKTLPRFGLFVQGGYGKPGLNMLRNDFTGYYIAGLRLNWSLSSFYTLKKEKKILDISRDNLDVQREIFLFNTRLSLQQQDAEMDKMQQLISTDHEIIQLRNSIKHAAAAQLENGVITTNDYLREVNAEDQARQNMLLHEIQLLMAQYNHQVTSGNQ